MTVCALDLSIPASHAIRDTRNQCREACEGSAVVSTLNCVVDHIRKHWSLYHDENFDTATGLERAGGIS